jgi:3-dehydroquinate dehydratase II
MNKSVLILNGPGLADLSNYRKYHDGTLSLAGIRSECDVLGRTLGLDIDFRQSDDQDEVARWIAKDSKAFDGVIINPVGRSRAADPLFQGYRSALQTIAKLNKPIVEVHITNIYRQAEDVSPMIHGPAGEIGFVCGFGRYGYLLALRALASRLGLAATS